MTMEQNAGDLMEGKFFVRGVVYQPRSTFNPISDDCLPQLEQDVLLFKELGLNTLLVYFIDSTKEHGKAMKLLEEAGIYVLTMVSTRFCAINRLRPYESYNPATISSFFKTLDVMASYPNTLGVAAATQVVNRDDTMSAVPVIKAVVRDLKRYMKLKNEVCQQRILPICYDADRIGVRDKKILDYLAYGDISSSIDFWMCKKYSWTGDPITAQSDYDDLIDLLGDAALPILFSEYSDKRHEPRLFHETKSLYSPRTCQVFSGGCAYELWQGANEYGLVELLKSEADTSWSSVRAAMARASDDRKVVEKRETDQGLLLIFHDFANYKANLAATRSIESDWDRDFLHREELESRNRDIAQMDWPWEPEFCEPESCVDWKQAEELARSHN